MQKIMKRSLPLAFPRTDLKVNYYGETEEAISRFGFKAEIFPGFNAATAVTAALTPCARLRVFCTVP